MVVLLIWYLTLDFLKERHYSGILKFFVSEIFMLGFVYAYKVLYFQDFSKECLDKLGHGKYTPMDVSLLPPLHLIYADNPSDSGKVSF